MTLNKEIKDKIKRHSLEELPNECCGLVIENKKTKAMEIFRCENKMEDKELGFSLSPRDYLEASRSGEILAAYHSHPDDSDEFSLVDKTNSRNNNINYVLYCVGKDKFLKHSPNEPYEDYTGRDFEIGTSDCITLVKDFWSKELGIHTNEKFTWSVLKKTAPVAKRGDSIPQEWTKIAEEIGFEKLEFDFSVAKNFKNNDCILLYPDNDTYVCHLLIYIGNGKVLYQPNNRKSQIKNYGKFFIKNTACILRRKGI